ncbi:MAG: hypothetical protein ACFFHD_09110, partial [Promethearchaeota archaeon]
MTELTEKSREEYEKKIERLKYENQDLKMRLEKLEKENFRLQEKIALIEKPETVLEQKPIEIEAKTSISVDFQEGIEEPIEIFNDVEKEIEPRIRGTQFDEIEKKSSIETPLKDVSEIIYEQTHPDFAKKPVVEGNSRRECPICGNANKMQIYEIID